MSLGDHHFIILIDPSLHPIQIVDNTGCVHL